MLLSSDQPKILTAPAAFPSDLPSHPSNRSNASSEKKSWYGHVNIDLIAHVLNTSILHPFVAWIIPLSLRAVARPYSDPQFQISCAWAAFVTFLAILGIFNQRIAYGVPRDLDWEEEVVVVTGGASGLGLLIAETYGMRGASVAVLDVKEVENAEDRGVVSYVCDVGSRSEVERVAKQIEKDLGTPTILINNAGIVNGKPLLQLTEQDLTRNFNTNLLSHFHTIQTFLPGMLNVEAGGTIVTLSSILGHLGASRLSDYSASKAGLIAMHNSLVAELKHSTHEGAKFVKTILVTPGQIATPMFRGMQTPNKFLGPVVEPVELAKMIVKMIDSGESGVLALPLYARWMQWMNVMPAAMQRVLRWASGVDTAMSKGFAKGEKA